MKTTTSAAAAATTTTTPTNKNSIYSYNSQHYLQVFQLLQQNPQQRRKQSTQKLQQRQQLQQQLKHHYWLQQQKRRQREGGRRQQQQQQLRPPFSVHYFSSKDDDSNNFSHNIDHGNNNNNNNSNDPIGEIKFESQQQQQKQKQQQQQKNKTQQQQQQQQQQHKEQSESYNKLLTYDTDLHLYKDMMKQYPSLNTKGDKKGRDRTAKNVQRAMLGNLLICGAKLFAWVSSGSSSMMSEFVHSVVDCGNQGLLLMGLRDSQYVADMKHPYGYGKSVYFWALVSALGTFFMGAGVSFTHSINELFDPSIRQVIGWEVWFVLSMSFVIDGYVLVETIKGIAKDKRHNVSFYRYISNMRDPATLAILLEDGAACFGVVIAFAGLSATHITGMPVFDGLAGVSISVLLASMGVILARMNHRFLLGQAVDKEIIDDIQQILLSRRSIDEVHSVQSQWTGPETFSYKAEVDFDGTFLAAKLMPRYQHEFIQIQKHSNGNNNNNNIIDYDQDQTTGSSMMKSELRLLLSWYAEDVIRTVEREVRHIEALIRKKYPGAAYIELEPMSKFADKYAIDDSEEDDLRQNESEALFRLLQSLNVQLNVDSMNTTPLSSSSTSRTSTASTSTSTSTSTSHATAVAAVAAAKAATPRTSYSGDAAPADTNTAAAANANTDPTDVDVGANTTTSTKTMTATTTTFHNNDNDNNNNNQMKQKEEDLSHRGGSS